MIGDGLYLGIRDGILTIKAILEMLLLLKADTILLKEPDLSGHHPTDKIFPEQLILLKQLSLTVTMLYSLPNN